MTSLLDCKLYEDKEYVFLLYPVIFSTMYKAIKYK